MSKKGQHKHDSFDQRISRGPNNPDKSVTITTGTYKKPETYKKQAAEHEDPHQIAQAAKNDWRENTIDEPRNSRAVRAREVRGEGDEVETRRSGSHSNAHGGR